MVPRMTHLLLVLTVATVALAQSPSVPEFEPEASFELLLEPSFEPLVSFEPVPAINVPTVGPTLRPTPFVVPVTPDVIEDLLPEESASPEPSVEPTLVDEAGFGNAISPLASLAFEPDILMLEASEAPAGADTSSEPDLPEVFVDSSVETTSEAAIEPEITNEASESVDPFIASPSVTPTVGEAVAGPEAGASIVTPAVSPIQSTVGVVSSAGAPGAEGAPMLVVVEPGLNGKTGPTLQTGDRFCREQFSPKGMAVICEPKVKADSVKFFVNDMLVSTSTSPPYAIKGNTGGDIAPWRYGSRTATIVCEPNVGEPVSVKITFVCDWSKF